MPKRSIILDTETTGLSHKGGDRLIEIGAIELIDYVETGVTFHKRYNPDRDVPEAATKVHGITLADLQGEPRFRSAYKEFLEFIGDDELVIHNAPFDMGFLNAELQRIGQKPLSNPVVDTVQLAREKYGRGARVSLDALADRLNIDRSARVVHGALIDCVILAEVYVCLIDKNTLLHGENRIVPGKASVLDTPFFPEISRHRWFTRNSPIHPSVSESQSHSDFVEKIEDSLWKRLSGQSA